MVKVVFQLNQRLCVQILSRSVKVNENEGEAKGGRSMNEKGGWPEKNCGRVAQRRNEFQRSEKGREGGGYEATEVKKEGGQMNDNGVCDTL